MYNQYPMVLVPYLSRSYLAALPTWLRTMATGVGRASRSARFCVGLPRGGKRFCRPGEASAVHVCRRAGVQACSGAAVQLCRCARAQALTAHCARHCARAQRGTMSSYLYFKLVLVVLAVVGDSCSSSGHNLPSMSLSFIND